ncbi:two-partner secretion domain-containing protein [Yersinia rohdei]|uniref:two-partner secretion domain-containing protein n=1 Tax=Yersinia rohdei TaxID=29485 RepID=UPI0011A4DC03|nr:filamentous hemagglutinin N-terminal domain-containing protein [Yersinia rohdei]
MNSKLYKLVFCRRLGCWIAVGEFTQTYGKSFSVTGRKLNTERRTRLGIISYLAIMTGLALGTLPLLVLAHPSLPVNGKIVIGQGRLDINNTTLTVTQQSDQLAINWGSFDIAQGNSVIYNQPGGHSIVLNRVVGRDASQIYGSLKANGQIFLLNPHGVLFGKGAEVNVGGLVASTKSLSDQDFIDGRYRLTSPKQEGSVINQANLRTIAGGYIALVGQRVNNQDSGVIDAKGGRAILAAGQHVTLNLDHGQLLGVQIQGEQVAALIQNGGLIKADGGVIQLTARGKDMLMNTVIDNTGILQAKGLSENNGVIQLDGGDDGVVKQQGVINASHPQGRGGEVILHGKNIHLVAGSKIEARGDDGGGNVWVGGGWQGNNRLINNTHSVVIDKAAQIDVSAMRKGDGGTAVLWSDNYTGFYGEIKASGGAESGDGGKVETSSLQNLQAFGQVDTAANYGQHGTWLLDPAEVTIVSGTESSTSMAVGDIPAGYASNAQVFIPTANIAQILNSSINAQLDKGANVTITTSNNSLPSCRWCNITVQADINKTAGTDATLTLHADGSVISNSNITANAGKLNLNLLSGNSAVDSEIILNNSDVLLNGGDLLAKNANDNNTARISIVGGKYEVGNLTLEGNAGVASQIGVNITNSANITVAGKTHISGESSNANGQGWRGIDISGNSTLTGQGDVIFNLTSNSKTAWIGSFTNTAIVSGGDIIFNVNGAALGGLEFNYSNLTANSGNIAIKLNGNVISSANPGIYLNVSQVSAQQIGLESYATGAGGIVLENSTLTSVAGDINAHASAINKGVWIKGNSTLTSNRDVVLVGKSTVPGEGVIINGSANNSRSNVVARRNIILDANNINGSSQSKSMTLENVNLASAAGNITINSIGSGNVHFTNIELNATEGHVSVYAEAQTAFTSAIISALSLGGNNTIKAKNGLLIGNALNTTQGAGIGFRANSVLAIEGNIAFQGETGGTGATRKGIDFYGVNTLNIAKESQLSLVGENKGTQDTAGGNGITHSGQIKLTVNNNGSLIMDGRSTSGAGINFPASNNTVILNGDGETLLKGSSVAGSGVAISGVVNNSTGPVTIEGISVDGAGVHIFSAEHQINRINIAGNSTHAEGLRISGNATITDTQLSGNSISGSGIKVGFSATTHAVLDNAALNGISTDGKGVEITSDINGIHQSTINGITNGAGHGIDIAENVNVTGTSETDLLTLKGIATTGIGTGIKLKGNNDLSNTSLNASAVDGIALDITGPLHNARSGLNGTASGRGIGGQINGSLNSSVVNGSALSGIGVLVNGSLADSRLSGVSKSGSGLKIDGDSILNNSALMGNSTVGKGVEIAGNLTGNQSSAVRGDTVNGTGVEAGDNSILTGGGADDPLTVTGNASGDKGIGVHLDGNNILENTSLAGNATGGHGVEINGPLTNQGNTTISGNASGNGHGVHADGPVNGGLINGYSGDNHGVYLAENGGLTELVVTGGTDSDKTPLHITSPQLIGENVTINGKPFDITNPGSHTGREGDNPNTDKTKPDPTKPDQITGDKTAGKGPKMTLSVPVDFLQILLMKREQILSAIEGERLPPAIVTDSEKDITANVSIAVCILQGIATQSAEQESCDQHVLGRWKPWPQTEQPK